MKFQGLQEYWTWGPRVRDESSLGRGLCVKRQWCWGCGWCRMCCQWRHGRCGFSLAWRYTGNLPKIIIFFLNPSGGSINVYFATICRSEAVILRVHNHRKWRVMHCTGVQCWLLSPIMISDKSGCKTGEYLCRSNAWETLSSAFKKVEIPFSV